VVAVVLALESLGLAAVTVLLIVATLDIGGDAATVGSGVALAVVAAVLAAGLAFTARGMLRGSKWTRPAAMVWQVVQILVGLDATQGVGPRYDLAALLVIPALVALVLLFSRSVSETMRRT